jgi:2-polyprenyl-6-methoxyphenol hydroxylase-like FAD-dependent oxidoreductase
MPPTLTTRCCIAGGGPAGIMLGYQLARAGIETIILEKHSDFLRDFRGDTIHPSTMEVLYELGLLKDFLNLPHYKVTRARAMIGDELITLANFFDDFSHLKVHAPFIAFTPQWDFLNFISDAGKKYPQFNLMMDTEVTGLIEEDGRIIGVRAKNKEGELEILTGLVIGADGRNSIVREKANLNIQKKGAPIDVLWFRLSKKEGDEEQLFGFINNGKMMGMIDRGDYWQCAFLIAKGDFDKIRSDGLDNFRKGLVKLAPFTEGRISELQDWDAIKLLSVKVDRLEKWYRPGLLCIGDAAHAMSPLGGVGINLAIQDSVAAANILIPAFRIGLPGKDDLAKIQKRRTFPTKITQMFQVFMQDRVLIPYLKTNNTVKAPFVLKLFNWFPILRRLPARFIGIGVRPEHIEWIGKQ